MAANTLLVDGTDLRTITGIKVTGDMQLYAPGRRRGSHETIPGRRGQLGAALPLDAYQFSVTVHVSGASREAMVANLMALGPILDTDGDGLVTLERRLAKTASPFYDSHTAAGQFAGGLAIQLLNHLTGKTELTFVNLDGGWWNGSTWLVP